MQSVMQKVLCFVASCQGKRKYSFNSAITHCSVLNSLFLPQVITFPTKTVEWVGVLQEGTAADHRVAFWPQIFKVLKSFSLANATKDIHTHFPNLAFLQMANLFMCREGARLD